METIRCAHCNKETDKDKAVSHKIWFRTREQVYNDLKRRYENKAVSKSHILLFCSGECAGNHQFAMEG